MLSDFMGLRAEPEAAVVVGPQSLNSLAQRHQLPTARFPEVNATFPPLTYHHTNIDNVYPAAGRCVWEKKRLFVVSVLSSSRLEVQCRRATGSV